MVNSINKSEENLDLQVYRTFEDFYDKLIQNKIEFNNEKYKDVEDIFIIGGSSLYYHVYDNYDINLIYETVNDVEIPVQEFVKNGGYKITYFTRDIDINKYIKIASNEITSEILSIKNDEKINGNVKFITYQNKENINYQVEYLKLLRYVYDNGVYKDSRF